MPTIITSFREDFSVVKGNNWKPGVSFYDGTSGSNTATVKDCTDFDSLIVIKEEDSEDADVLEQKSINWIGRSVGTGNYKFTPTEIDDFGVTTVYYEIFIFNTSESDPILKSVKKGKLTVIRTLGKT